MKIYDFAFSWPEEREIRFIKWVKRECKQRNMNPLWIHDKNIESILKKIEDKQIKIIFLLDMNATYNKPDDLYAHLCYAVKDNQGMVLNDPDDARMAVDKSVTHYTLEKANIPTPFTVIIRNWKPDKMRISAEDKKRLGSPFVIKPASGYGQFGVITDAVWNLEKIAKARDYDRGDNFLLQEKIIPVDFNKQVGWFRILYLFGQIIPTWWDPKSGQYKQVTMKDISNFKLYPIINIHIKFPR